MQLQELQRRFGPCPHPQAEAHCWYIPSPCYQKKGESCMKAAAGDPRHGCVFSLGSRSVSQDPGVAFSSLLLALAWVGPGLGELGLWVMIKLLYSGLASNNMWHYGEKLFNLSKKKGIVAYGLKNIASRVMFWAWILQPSCNVWSYFVYEEGGGKLLSLCSEIILLGNYQTRSVRHAEAPSTLFWSDLSC